MLKRYVKRKFHDFPLWLLSWSIWSNNKSQECRGRFFWPIALVAGDPYTMLKMVYNLLWISARNTFSRDTDKTPHDKNPADKNPTNKPPADENPTTQKPPITKFRQKTRILRVWCCNSASNPNGNCGGVVCVSKKWVIAWKITHNSIKSCFTLSIMLQTNSQS